MLRYYDPVVAPTGRHGFAGIRRRGIASDRFRGSGTREGELSGSERVNKVPSTKPLGSG